MDPRGSWSSSPFIHSLPGWPGSWHGCYFHLYLSSGLQTASLTSVLTYPKGISRLACSRADSRFSFPPPPPYRIPGLCQAPPAQKTAHHLPSCLRQKPRRPSRFLPYLSTHQQLLSSHSKTHLPDLSHVHSPSPRPSSAGTPAVAPVLMFQMTVFKLLIVNYYCFLQSQMVIRCSCADYRYTAFYCTPLCRASQIMCFYWLNVYDNLALSKSLGTIFSKTFAYFLSVSCFSDSLNISKFSLWLGWSVTLLSQLFWGTMHCPHIRRWT